MSKVAFTDLNPSKHNLALKFGYSFICQGTSTRRQRRNLFGLRVKLPPQSNHSKVDPIPLC